MAGFGVVGPLFLTIEWGFGVIVLFVVSMAMKPNQSKTFC